jgi:hypothetical protein
MATSFLSASGFEHRCKVHPPAGAIANARLGN